MLILHDPIRETLHALTRSAVYGMFAALLAPPADAQSLANPFEQAHNLAGTVSARLPFAWSASSLLSAVAVARRLDPAELLRRRAAALADGPGGKGLALAATQADDAPADSRLAWTFGPSGVVRQPDLPAGHLVHLLRLLRRLAEREADADTPAERSGQRIAQVDAIDRHLGPRVRALAGVAAVRAGVCPFAGVLVALEQWLTRDRRWLGGATGVTVPG
jgi:hypothetical protein